MQPKQQHAIRKSTTSDVKPPINDRKTPSAAPVVTAVAVAKTTTLSADARRASKVLLADGDEEGYQDALNKLKIDALVPLIEDLADWLNTVIG